jgi:glyoxylase-like metal-dependent hydrolase (beta-lactamase superfamily II)
VASAQTVVRFDATGDIAVGDLVHHNTHAWLEGGIVNGKASATLDGWRANLRALPALAPKAGAKVYGGRGPAVGVAQAVAQQTAYLDSAEATVSRYVQALGQRKAELSDPAQQGVHHAAIQAQFVKASPTYAMPDLVGYSVYGLINSVLAAGTVKTAP